MLKQRRAGLRNTRLEIGLALSFGQHISFQEGHDFVQHGHLAGRFNEVDDGVRQPEEVVGDPRSHTTPRWRVPPVLTSPSRNCREAARSRCSRATPQLATHKAIPSWSWSRKPYAPLN